MPSVLGAAVFALLTLALLAVHVLYFAPNRARVERATPFAGDRSPLAEAMDSVAVAARFRAISDLGSRAPGQLGLEATAQYIEDDFSKLGFEIYRQDVDIPYPLLREGSGWMSNETFRLDVLPFRPNFVQPVTTGANGIDGELFLATDDAIRGGVDFTGKIAVIDTGGSIFKDFGLDPVRYADIGFAAVVITHAEGLEKVPWEGRAALGFDATEPLAGQMPLLCTNGWFTAEQQEADGEPRPVILPDVLAAQLGIAPEMVEAGAIPIVINGKRFFVHNVFDSARISEVVDPDGANLLPYDGLSMNNMKFGGWGVILAEDTDPRVAPADLVLVLADDLEMDRRGIRTASIAVDMGDVPYATAQGEISRYKEQSGFECFYALSGTAFRGSRARTRSLAGFADLIVPLLIAAITVLNTMKGSVYERQGEIGIYNAIGIAPRHIFFMFVAEALVYSVLAFLHDYFDSLGEGSSGIFFSGRPELRVSDRLDDFADNAYIPELKVRVWLKPFDLGVSQDVEIELGTDPETREYIAKMTISRITGTLESWHRLNKPFVTAVRRQFLHWRAVGDAQKSALFAKAKALMNG